MATTQEAIASKHSTCPSVKREKGFARRLNDSPKYSERVQELSQQWSQFAVMLCDLSKWPQAKKQEMVGKLFLLIRESFTLLLHTDGKKGANSVVKTHLKKQVTTCQDSFKNVNELLVSQCSTIIDLLIEPWGSAHSTLRKLIQGEQCEDTAVCEFLRADRHVLKLRIHVLCEDKAPDLAQRLAAVVWKHHLVQNGPLSEYGEQEVQYIADLYIVLLVKLNKHKEVFNEMKDLTLSQGLDLVQRLRTFHIKPPGSCKVWKKSRKAAEVVIQYFAIRAMKEQIDTRDTTISFDLLLEWVDIFSSTEEFLDLIEKISSQAFSLPHLFTFCRALTTKSKSRLRLKCIAMYIKGLTVEMNHLEQLRGAENKEAVRRLEEELSLGFLELAELLSSNLNDSRECVLTAFSLNPIASCLDKVTEMAELSGKIKTEILDTGQPMDASNTDIQCSIDLTLHRSLRDDLAAVLHCLRFRDLSWTLDWPDLKEKCENYVKERESGESRVVKELKYLNIDYDKLKHLPSREDENHDGIEKGYELELETVSLEETYDDDEFSPDFNSSPSEAGSDTSFTMKKYKRSESIDPKRKKARPRRSSKRNYVSSDDSRGKCHVENTPGKKLKCQRKPKGKTPKSDSKRNGKPSVMQLQVCSVRERNVSTADGVICSTPNNANHRNHSNLSVPEIKNLLNTREPRNPQTLESLRKFRKHVPRATKEDMHHKSEIGAAFGILSKRKSGCQLKCVPGLNSFEMIVPGPQRATVQVVQVHAHGKPPSQSAASGTATAAAVGPDNGAVPKQDAESVNGRASGSETQQANLVTPKLSAASAQVPGSSGGIRRDSPALAQIQTSQGWVNVPAHGKKTATASSQATASGPSLPQFRQAFGFGRSEALSAGSTLKQALLSSEKPKLAATSAAGFGSQAQPAGLGAPTLPPAQTPSSTSTPTPLAITSSSSPSLSQPPLPPPPPAVQPGFGTATQQQPGFGTPAQPALQVGFTTQTQAPSTQVLVKTTATLSAPGLILASSTTQGRVSTTSTTSTATSGTSLPTSTVIAVSTTSSLLVTTAQSTSNITVGTPSAISAQGLMVLKAATSGVPATGHVSRHLMPALVQRSFSDAPAPSTPTSAPAQLALVPAAAVHMSAALVPMKRPRGKGTQLVLSKQLSSPATISRPVGLSTSSQAPVAAAAAAAAVKAEAAAEAAGAPSNASRPLRQSTPPVINNSNLEAELLEFETILQQVTLGKQSTSAPNKERQPLPEDSAKPTVAPATPTARAVQTDSVAEATLIPLPQPSTKPLPAIASATVSVSSSFTQTMPSVPPTLPVVSQSPSPQNSVSPVTTPCPSVTGTPVKKKPKPKTVTSPAIATTPSDRGTVKTPSTPIGATANCNKLNQKTTEDEHTTARILSILRQYDEQLRCSPEINNKPAPRRRNQIQAGASPGKRKKNKGKSNLPELSPSTDDTHTMGSEDSSIASHFADGILEATPTSPLSTGDDRSLASTVTTSSEATPCSTAVTSFAGVTRSASIGLAHIQKPSSPPRPPSVPVASPTVAVSTPSRTPTPQPTQDLPQASRVVHIVETTKSQVSQIVQTPPPLQISASNVPVDSPRPATVTRVPSSHLARALQTPQATQTPLLAKALETPTTIPQLIQSLVSHQNPDQNSSSIQTAPPPPAQIQQVTRAVRVSQAPQQLVRVSQATQVQPVTSGAALVPQGTQTIQHIRLAPAVHASQQTQQVPQLIQTSKLTPQGILSPPAQTHALTRIVQVSQPTAMPQGEPAPQLVQISTPQVPPSAQPVPQLAQVSSPQLRTPDGEEAPSTSPPKNMVYMVPVSSSSQLPVVVSSGTGMIQVGQLGTLGTLGNNMQHAVVVRQIPKHADGKAPGEVTRDTFLLNVSSRSSQPMFISSIQQLLSASQTVTAIPPLSASSPAATVAQSQTVVTTTSPVFTVANAMESAVLADSTASTDNSTTAAVAAAAPTSSLAPITFSTDTATSAATPSTPTSTQTAVPLPVTPNTPVRGSSSGSLTPVSSPTSSLSSPVTSSPTRPPTLLGLQLQFQQQQQIQQHRMKQQMQAEEDKQTELQKNKQLHLLIQQKPLQHLSQPVQPAPLAVPPPVTQSAVPKEEQPTLSQPMPFKTTNPTHLKQLLEQAPQPLPPLQPTMRLQAAPSKVPMSMSLKCESLAKGKPGLTKQQHTQEMEKLCDRVSEKSLAQDLSRNTVEKEVSDNPPKKSVVMTVSECVGSISQATDNILSSSIPMQRVSTPKIYPPQKPTLPKSSNQKPPILETTAQNFKKRAKPAQKYPPKISTLKDVSASPSVQKQPLQRVHDGKQCFSSSKTIINQHLIKGKVIKEILKSTAEVSIGTTLSIQVTDPQPLNASKVTAVQTPSSKGSPSVTSDISIFSTVETTPLVTQSDADVETQSPVLQDLSELPDNSILPSSLCSALPVVHDQKPSSLLQALETLSQDNQVSPAVSESPSSPGFEGCSESKAAFKTRQQVVGRQRTCSHQNSSSKSDSEQAVLQELGQAATIVTPTQSGGCLQSPISTTLSIKKPNRKKPEAKAILDPDPVVSQHISDTIMRVSMGVDCSSSHEFQPNLVKEGYYEGEGNIPVEVAVAALCGDIDDAEGLIEGNLDGDLKKGGEITLLPVDPADNADEFSFSPFKSNLKKIPDHDIKKETCELDEPQAHSSLSNAIQEPCLKEDLYAGQETSLMKLLKRKTSSCAGSLSEHSRSLSGSEDSSTSNLLPDDALSLTLSPSFLEFAQMSPSNSQDAVSASPEPTDKKKRCPIVKSYLSKVQLNSGGESFCTSIPKSELEIDESRVKIESNVNNDVSSLREMNQLNGGANSTVDDGTLSSQVLTQGPVMEMFFESTSASSTNSQCSSISRALLPSLQQESVRFPQPPQVKQELNETDCVPEMSSFDPVNHDDELPPRSAVNVDEEPWGKEPLYPLCDQSSDTEDDFWGKSLTSDIIDVDNISGMGEVLTSSSGDCPSRVVRASMRSSSRRSSTPQRKKEAIKRKDISADASSKKQPVDKKKRLGPGVQCNDEEESLVKCGSVLRSVTKALSSGRKDQGKPVCAGKEEVSTGVSRRSSSRTHKPVTKLVESQKQSKATNRPSKGVAHKKK